MYQEELNARQDSRDSLFYLCNFAVFLKLFQDEKLLLLKKKGGGVEAIIFEPQILGSVFLTYIMKKTGLQCLRDKVTSDEGDHSW